MFIIIDRKAGRAMGDDTTGITWLFRTYESAEVRVLRLYEEKGETIYDIVEL